MTLDDQLALRAAWYRRDRAREKNRIRFVVAAIALSVASVVTVIAFLPMLLGRG